MPTDRKLFNYFYFDEDELQIQNEEMLRDKLRDAFSFYEKKDDENYPKSGTVERKVLMNKKQMEEYGKYVKKILFFNKIPKEGQSLFDFDFDQFNRRTKNSFLTATRQISNTINGSTEFPKIQEIVEEMLVNPFPAIVYSNFLKNGVYPIAQMLTKKDITYKLITGSTTHGKIVKIVNDYNSGKFQVLLLSSAGSESLDLKNTRQIHIMEPHWNEPKIRQVIGRAIRYKSHISLPLNERNVTIYRWMSVFDKTKYANISADEYLVNLSNKKKKIFENFKDIIIESSIEYTNRNQSAGFYYKQYKKYLRKYKNNRK